MTTEESTTKYFIPPTKGKSRFLFGPVLIEIAKIIGIDKKAAEQRMRNKLIKIGWIKESRSELDYWQTDELISQYTKFLAERGIHIKPRNHS